MWILNAVRSYSVERDLQWEHTDSRYDELFPNFGDRKSYRNQRRNSLSNHTHYFFTYRQVSNMSSLGWTNRGKTIAGLIKELQTFEDQNLEVRISIDGGDSSVPISLVARKDGKYALLMNCEDAATIIQHDHNR